LIKKWSKKIFFIVHEGSWTWIVTVSCRCPRIVFILFVSKTSCLWIVVGNTLCWLNKLSQKNEVDNRKPLYKKCKAKFSVLTSSLSWTNIFHYPSIAYSYYWWIRKNIGYIETNYWFVFRSLGTSEWERFWNQTTDCNSRSTHGLVKSQKRMCARNLELMYSIVNAAKSTAEVCQFLFHESRWNCSSIRRAPNFSPDLTIGLYLLYTNQYSRLVSILAEPRSASSNTLRAPPPSPLEELIF